MNQYLDVNDVVRLKQWLEYFMKENKKIKERLDNLEKNRNEF